MTLTRTPFENIVGKGENAGNPFPNKPLFLHVYRKSLLKTLLKRAISRFPTVLNSVCLENYLPFSLNLRLSSGNCIGLEEYKICRLEKG